MILDNSDIIIDTVSLQAEENMFKNMFCNDMTRPAAVWDVKNRILTTSGYMYVCKYNDVLGFEHYTNDKFISIDELAGYNITLNANLYITMDIIASTGIHLSDIPMISGNILFIGGPSHFLNGTHNLIQNFIDCKPKFNMIDIPNRLPDLKRVLQMDCMGLFDGIKYSFGNCVAESMSLFNAIGIKSKNLHISLINRLFCEWVALPGEVISLLHEYDSYDKIAKLMTHKSVSEQCLFILNIFKILSNNPGMTIHIYGNTSISLSPDKSIVVEVK